MHTATTRRVGFNGFSGAVGCALALGVACGGSELLPSGDEETPAAGGGSFEDVGDGAKSAGGSGDSDTASGGMGGAIGSGGVVAGSGGVVAGSGGVVAGSGGATTGAGGGSGGSNDIGDGSTGVVEVLGSECHTPAALACAGNHQRVSLICTGGTWQVNETCPTNHACDSTPGFDQGTCKERLPTCANHEPGHSYCGSSTTLLTCGPDNVTVDPLVCGGGCYNDACDDRPNYCRQIYWSRCGEECGPRTCDVMWSTNCVPTFSMSVSTAGERWLRTPDYASTCGIAECDGALRSISATISRPSTSRVVRVIVPEPWYVELTHDPHPADLTCPTSTARCLTYNTASAVYTSRIRIFTDDPTATEANVLFETGGAVTCP